MSRRRLRILTWHVHGSYLYYLSQAPHEFFLPVRAGRPEGYGGRSGSFSWGTNVHEVQADRVHSLDFDCVLYQSRRNYREDRADLLSDAQLRGPQLYLEHDPPTQHPTAQPHPVDDPEIPVIHVTHFNRLMWDTGRSPVRVIRHGVMVPDVTSTGRMERGITVVNNLFRRGRRLGPDLFEAAAREIPIDLAGMDSEARGGLGGLPRDRLLPIEAGYRFFFNPIRYTSLGLAVCEAMMLGLPVVALATTELPAVIENGRTGFLDTSLEPLIEKMRWLLTDAAEARRIGTAARESARDLFGIDRFVRDWDAVFQEAAGFAGAPVAHPLMKETQV